MRYLENFISEPDYRTMILVFPLTAQGCYFLPSTSAIPRILELHGRDLLKDEKEKATCPFHKRALVLTVQIQLKALSCNLKH